MKREYSFFDMEPVIFDDEESVKALMACVFDRSDCYEPAGMDIVTALDARNRHIVVNTENKCKDELTSEDNRGLCVAY